MGWELDIAVVGPIQCNCYILTDNVSGKAYLIDPGAESAELEQYLQKRKLEIQAILITHAHLDHIGGIEYMRTQTAAPVFYHAGDRFLYENVTMQAQLFGVTPAQLMAKQPRAGDGSLNDDQRFEFDGGAVRVIHTPGHTPGSVCFHAKGEANLLFTGDTLFAGSIGRTDLWGGDYDQIIESIQGKLMVLDDSVTVLPGHGPKSTVGEERRSNPFLQQRPF
jgi:glyoxylase-like metal-dependent hydrolase (beta-lactamase superfamily II)